MLDRLAKSFTAPSTADAHGRGHQPSSARERYPLRALILVPTRELAAQIGDSLRKYGQHTRLKYATVVGGVPQFAQVKAVRSGVDVLVATPGRLIDLMEQNHISLSKIEVVVLDEADQMLDMGFLPALKRIMGQVPRHRQTLMFSATMPPAIRRLTEQWLKAPESIEIVPAATPAERIAQSVHLVEKKDKPDLLCWFLKNTPRDRTLVFSRTKHGADKIVKRLQRDGLPALAIHGNKSQGVRTRVLEQFKGRNPPILVATDIAARGLDIRDVSHIINYDLPQTPEIYIHRIGRTARAGRAGIAVSFCASDERGLLRQIESLMKCRLAVAKDRERPAEDAGTQEVRPAAPRATVPAPRARAKPPRAWRSSRYR